MDLEQQMMRDLSRFHALRAHSDDAFAKTLDELQHWQTERLKASHKELIDDPQFEAAADFFIGDMYGGIDLTQMAAEVERALNLALKLLPEKVMMTAAVALEANAITLELDEAMTAHYLAHYQGQNLDSDIWVACYKAVERKDDRIKQLELLKALGAGLDNYVRSRMIQGAFKLARKPAAKAGFSTLYDFLEKGFLAIKPIPSAEGFIDQIIEPELKLVDGLIAGINPFNELDIAKV